MSFYWKAPLSKAVFIAPAWNFYFYGFAFGQMGVGFIRRERKLDDRGKR